MLKIPAEGFRDAEGSYMTSTRLNGVWVSDMPLDFNEGSKGDAFLRLTSKWNMERLGPYELIEHGKGYREWCVPARLLNRYFTLRIADWGFISLQRSNLKRSTVMRRAATARGKRKAQ